MTKWTDVRCINLTNAIFICVSTDSIINLVLITNRITLTIDFKNCMVVLICLTFDTFPYVNFLRSPDLIAIHKCSLLVFILERGQENLERH